MSLENPFTCLIMTILRTKSHPRYELVGESRCQFPHRLLHARAYPVRIIEELGPQSGGDFVGEMINDVTRQPVPIGGLGTTTARLGVGRFDPKRRQQVGLVGD